jgi:uncharacterized membrane protein YbhN (UPF0104 family)
MGLKLLLTVAAAWILYRKLDWQRLEQVWQAAEHWLLVPAFLAIAASKAASVPRLGLHLAAADCPISWRENARLYLAGLFYSLFLPGGIGGDGYKAYWLHRQYGQPVPKLVGALFLDRLSGLLALGLWTLILFWVSGLPSKLQWEPPYVVLAGALVLGAGVWVRSLLWSVVVQGFQLLGAWLLLLAIGLHAHQLLYLLVFLTSSVISTVVPVTLGGVGSRELVFAYAAEVLPLAKDASVLVAFLFFLLSALLSFSGVYYVYRSDRIAASNSRSAPKSSK